MTTTVYDRRTEEVQTYVLDIKRLNSLGERNATRLESLLTSGGVEALLMRGVHMDFIANVYVDPNQMRKATKKEPHIVAILEQDHEKFSRYLSTVMSGMKEIHLVIDQFNGRFYAT